MQKITRTLRIGLLYTLAVVTIGGVPLTALAETASQSTDLPTPVAASSDASTGTATLTAPATPTTTPPATDSVSTPVIAPASSEVPAAPLSVTQNTTAPTVDIAPAPTVTNTSVAPSTISPTTPSDAPIVPQSKTTTATTNATNDITSGAQSGSAQSLENTTVGDTSSGNATAVTTVINTVNSSVQGDTTGVAHFTADINGDVTGDITLAPSINGALSQSGSSTPMNNLQVSNSTGLTDNIDLNATSGNVDVASNTTAGNATTGNANTVANVVNLINSIIAANKSFVGTINIYGNLNGDILISPNFIPQLLASNTSNSTLNSALGPLTSDLSSENNQSIINNINLQAMSGGAAVTGNTTVGNVATGDAQTNLTVLNLTGQKIVASNSLLVFVNVLGKWVGMIVNAPGATAAALGNGVTSNTLNPFIQSINAQNNSQITNNINLASQSGNANVSDNTTVGDIRTGNATASANIANIATSSFSLSDWFGVLFINVFGSWYGSFGINTASGEVVPLDTTALPVNISSGSASVAPAVRFGFTPRNFATLHQNTLPLQMPAAATIVPISVTSASQEHPAVILTGALKENGVTDQSDDPIIVPAALGGTQHMNPLAIALMATGFAGMTAPVLAGLGRRRSASTSFKK